MFSFRSDRPSSRNFTPRSDFASIANDFKVSTLDSGIDLPRRIISCMPAITNQLGPPSPASSTNNIPTLSIDTNVAPTSSLASSSNFESPSSKRDFRSKSISEKVAEARQRRREPSSVQKMFLRTGSRAVPKTTRTLFVQSNKGSQAQRGRVSLDALPTSKETHSMTGNAHEEKQEQLSDRPRLQTRSESTKNIRRGRSFFRSLDCLDGRENEDHHINPENESSLRHVFSVSTIEKKIF